METITLSAVARETGKGANAKLRNEGKFPAVVYGGKENLNVALSAREFDNKFHTVSENHIIDLDVDGKTVHVLIKDYQKDWLRNKMIHVDFLEVKKGKELKTHVPVKVVGAGKSVGEKAGGLLEVFVHELEVVCLPKNLPEEIEVDITALEVGASIHVSDMTFPKGVKITNSPETVVVVMEHGAKASKVEVEEGEEAEAGAEAEAE